MANQKSNRTQIKDIATTEQELSGKAMKQVRGGKAGDPIKDSDIGLSVPGGKVTTTTTATTMTPPKNNIAIGHEGTK